MIPDTTYEQLMRLPNGARFYRVDLHNHTPADASFHCGGFSVQSEDDKRTFAREYVRFAKQDQRLDIIGISDHNDVTWIPYIQEAAAEVGLIVFPGIEVGAQSGKRQIHFLALFDPATSAQDLDHFLSSLQLTPGNRFHPDRTPKMAQIDSVELTRHIARGASPLRGLPIAAHVSGKNGLVHELEGEARILAYCDPNLLAVEIPEHRAALSEFERNLFSGKADDYGKKAVACLNHSDGRGLTQTHAGRLRVGDRATRVKLSHLSVEALRQAFVDFDSRVRLEGEYREEHYPRLLGLIVEGGFLSGQPEEQQSGGNAYRPFMVRFNPNLNTVIGGRGAGKSALLEAIRYTFDVPARTEETRAQANKIIQFTLLSPGARVTVYYELADGTRYKITRLKGGDPEVYDLITGERRNVAPAALLPNGVPLEVYGQKEVFEISKDVLFQLNLLDTFVADALRESQREERDLLRWLAANAQDILRLQEESAQASQRLQELEAVRLELERMERQEAVSRLERKKHLEREKALLDRAEGAVNERVKALERFQSGQDLLHDILPAEANLKAEKLPHAELMMKQATLLHRIDDVFSTSMEALRKQVNDIWATGGPERETWQAAYDSVQKEYEALVRELGQDFSAERYFALQAKLQTLEAIQKEVQRRDQRLQELHQERDQKLRMVRRLRRTREYRLRRDKAQQLTDQLQDNVRITLACEGNRDAYSDKLAELFAGRRVSKDVFEKLATARFPTPSGKRGAYTHPNHLVCAIRQERQKPTDDCSLLATIYGISKAYRERLAVVDDQTLYELETYRVPDLPDISLKVGTQHRSLNPPEGKPGLSTGQKCTAILSIILVERDAPLVIDQPEDDLDNEFIFRQIVQTLRREKERRQFIVVTHNANIPVAGDAELIAVMQADEKHGWIEQMGSIDDPEIREPVENILEGGRAAFRIRQMKYEIPE